MMGLRRVNADGAVLWWDQVCTASSPGRPLETGAGFRVDAAFDPPGDCVGVFEECAAALVVVGAAGRERRVDDFGGSVGV